MSVFFLSLKLCLLQTTSLSTVLPPPAKPERNAVVEDFPVFVCVCASVCTWIKHSYPPLCRGHTPAGHLSSQGHTHTQTETQFVGHAWLCTNYLLLFLSFFPYLLCAYLKEIHTIPPAENEWRVQLTAHTVKHCWVQCFLFFLSFFFLSVFPFLFIPSVFLFSSFLQQFLSFFPSVSEATQSATSEKVISDSSLYWD